MTLAEAVREAREKGVYFRRARTGVMHMVGSDEHGTIAYVMPPSTIWAILRPVAFDADDILADDWELT